MIEPNTPTVRVKLFARYAELIGAQDIVLPADVARSVADVLAHLRQLPGGNQLPLRPMVAVNLSHVREDASLRPGDEVALLPPLAGG